MTFVLDASVAANWCFPDESHPVADTALRMIVDAGAFAPTVLAFELRNVLLMAERRNRISEAQSAKFLGQFAEFSIVVDRETDHDLVLRLARIHRLTVYDAAYLELSLRKQVLLATLDGALTKAAHAEQVRLIDHHS